MPTLVLLRHGQSRWNIQQRFTGWVDVDLTEKGEAEAKRAGELIKAEGLAIDAVFASVLTRAIRTAGIALRAGDQLWVPMIKDWRLNERHYGGLTGLEHGPTRERYGAEQVLIWRRSFDIAPPPLEPGGEHDFAADRRYAHITPPTTESLKTTLARVLPYWTEAIEPRLAAGQTLLVAAHGNSLRSIAKHLFAISDADITALEIPTGNPLLVTLDSALKPIAARYLDAATAGIVPPILAALAG
jgi:2,3-bisphosphoglycerate-dependent phosphoglycerate mutase